MGYIPGMGLLCVHLQVILWKEFTTTQLSSSRVGSQINHSQHQRTKLNLFDANACFLLQIHVAIHTLAVGMDV